MNELWRRLMDRGPRCRHDKWVNYCPECIAEVEVELLEEAVADDA